MKGQRSNCTGVRGLRRGSRIPRCWEWIFKQWRSQIYSRSKKGGIFDPWPHTLRQRSEGWVRSGWNEDRLHYLYSFFPLFFAIKFTYHGVQTCTLIFLTMRARKSTLQKFEIPGCARIAGSLHMTIQTEVLIENLKDLSRDICWWYCKIFSTQEHIMTVITHDESASVFSWKGVSLEDYWDCMLNALISQKMMVRVTYLTWLLMVGVTWLFLSMRVRRRDRLAGQDRKSVVQAYWR